MTFEVLAADNSCTFRFAAVAAVAVVANPYLDSSSFYLQKNNVAIVYANAYFMFFCMLFLQLSSDFKQDG
jgi:hypothetical protein